MGSALVALGLSDLMYDLMSYSAYGTALSTTTVLTFVKSRYLFTSEQSAENVFTITSCRLSACNLLPSYSHHKTVLFHF